MKTPCEIIVWNVVPMIRREFAKNLIKNHKLNQRETANKLGVTEASVSRYISGKRAALGITNKKILKEIQKSAKRISKENEKSVIDETCRICRLIKETELIEGINYACE
jgi:predicted transcriptional regulator